MKASVIDSYGAAEVLQLMDIDQPPLKPNQIKVKLQAASVNPVDWKILNPRNSDPLLTVFFHWLKLQRPIYSETEPATGKLVIVFSNDKSSTSRLN